MSLVNLCPHSMIVEGVETVYLPPAAFPARLRLEETEVGYLDGIPIVEQKALDPVGLPSENQGVLLVVSSMLRVAQPHRLDLVSPTRLIRNDLGEVIGCRALCCNGSMVKL